MTLTPGVRNEELRRLRSVYPPDRASERLTAASHRRSVAGTLPAGMKRVVKGVIRRAIAWYVDPTAQAAAKHAARAASRRLEAQLPERGLGDEARITAINHELLTAEFRALRQTVEEMRRQPAMPNSLDPEALSERFRRDTQETVATQRERYLEMLRGHDPVLQVGCGRGELVGALTEAGIDAAGVDVDADAIAEAEALGRNVGLADALDALRMREPGSLGAVVALHHVAQQEVERVLDMVELAADRLRPGGLLIAEAPNPASLLVLQNTYLDPVQARPLHPSLLAFLCERAGFRNVEIRFYDPARSSQLPLIAGDAVPDWAATINTAFSRLNEVLFGPQAYAVIATA